jgi:hypothetical protein
MVPVGRVTSFRFNTQSTTLEELTAVHQKAINLTDIPNTNGSIVQSAVHFASIRIQFQFTRATDRSNLSDVCDLLRNDSVDVDFG